MVPIGAGPIIFLVKLQRLEWVRQSLTTTITIKLGFKFGKKIMNLSTKTFRWVDHIWTQLLSVRTRQMQKNSFELHSCWYKNARIQSNNTTNRIVKRQRKSAKKYVPEDPELDQSLLDSSSSESDSSDDIRYRKSKRKLRNKIKEGWKRKKQD